MLEAVFVVLITVMLKQYLMACYTLLLCCLKVLGFVLVFLRSSELSCKYILRRLEKGDKNWGPIDDNGNDLETGYLMECHVYLAPCKLQNV